MMLVSLNTGRPREVVGMDGRLVLTSIWKAPRDGRLRVAKHNVDGDEQSDLTVHGGPYKAVYCYPSEHYAYWRGELPGLDLASWGAFGENLTTEGLLETDVCIGDRIQIGSAEFQVTQPRQPCFKLQLRHGRDDLIKRFIASGRSGFYVSIVREGEIGAGDAVRVVERARDSISVAEIFALHFDDGARLDRVRVAAAAPGLAPGWREHFEKRAGRA
jgi:MOSC domain-containing protein YiiM